MCVDGFLPPESYSTYFLQIVLQRSMKSSGSAEMPQGLKCHRGQEALWEVAAVGSRRVCTPVP